MSDCEYPRIITRVKLVHVPFLLGDANGRIGRSDSNIFAVGYFTLWAGGTSCWSYVVASKRFCEDFTVDFKGMILIVSLPRLVLLLLLLLFG